jgi:hypothetical protein
MEPRLATVDSVEFLVLVDNSVDSLSTGATWLAMMGDQSRSKLRVKSIHGPGKLRPAERRLFC